MSRKSIYSDSICDIIVSLYENNRPDNQGDIPQFGATPSMIASFLGISDEEYELWREKYPKFKLVTDRGLTASKGKTIAACMKSALAGCKINASLMIFLLDKIYAIKSIDERQEESHDELMRLLNERRKIIEAEDAVLVEEYGERLISDNSHVEP